MSLSSLWTFALGRGFTGGPDFESCNDFELNLDGIGLETKIPADNVVVDDMSRQVNFPFHSHGWFERHSRQLWNHIYVPVLVHNWAYIGPYWKVRKEPFGLLSASFWLKRVTPGHVLSMYDLSTLEKAIHSDYRDFFEANYPGELGLGFNTEVRQKAEQLFGPKPFPTSRDLNAEKDRYLKQYLREIPERFERKVVANRDWVYYRVEQEPNYPSSHYCFPLDDRYYLDAFYHYRIDFPQYFHLWKAHAEAAEQRIMNSVRLTFPNS